MLDNQDYSKSFNRFNGKIFSQKEKTGNDFTSSNFSNDVFRYMELELYDSNSVKDKKHYLRLPNNILQGFKNRFKAIEEMAYNIMNKEENVGLKETIRLWYNDFKIFKDSSDLKYNFLECNLFTGNKSRVHDFLIPEHPNLPFDEHFISIMFPLDSKYLLENGIVKRNFRPSSLNDSDSDYPCFIIDKNFLEVDDMREFFFRLLCLFIVKVKIRYVPEAFIDLPYRLYDNDLSIFQLLITKKDMASLLTILTSEHIQSKALLIKNLYPHAFHYSIQEGFVVIPDHTFYVLTTDSPIRGFFTSIKCFEIDGKERTETFLSDTYIHFIKDLKLDHATEYFDMLAKLKKYILDTSSSICASLSNGPMKRYGICLNMDLIYCSDIELEANGKPKTFYLKDRMNFIKAYLYSNILQGKRLELFVESSSSKDYPLKENNMPLELLQTDLITGWSCKKEADKKSFEAQFFKSFFIHFYLASGRSEVNYRNNMSYLLEDLYSIETVLDETVICTRIENLKNRKWDSKKQIDVEKIYKEIIKSRSKKGFLVSLSPVYNFEKSDYNYIENDSGVACNEELIRAYTKQHITNTCFFLDIDKNKRVTVHRFTNNKLAESYLFNEIAIDMDLSEGEIYETDDFNTKLIKLFFNNDIFIKIPFINTKEGYEYYKSLNAIKPIRSNSIPVLYKYKNRYYLSKEFLKFNRKYGRITNISKIEDERERKNIFQVYDLYDFLSIGKPFLLKYLLSPWDTPYKAYGKAERFDFEFIQPLDGNIDEKLLKEHFVPIKYSTNIEFHKFETEIRFSDHEMFRISGKDCCSIYVIPESNEKKIYFNTKGDFYEFLNEKIDAFNKVILHQHEWHLYVIQNRGIYLCLYEPTKAEYIYSLRITNLHDTEFIDKDNCRAIDISYCFSDRDESNKDYPILNSFGMVKVKVPEENNMGITANPTEILTQIGIYDENDLSETQIPNTEDSFQADPTNSVINISEEKYLSVQTDQILNWKDSNSVTLFANSIQKEMNENVSSILSKTLEIDKTRVYNMEEEIKLVSNSIDEITEKVPSNVFEKFFGIKSKDPDISLIRTRYNETIEKLDLMIKKMETNSVALSAKIGELEKLSNINKNYFDGLEKYIEIGKKELIKLEEENNTNNFDKLEKMELESFISRLKKKLQDLETSKLVIVQSVAQIDILKNASRTILEKISNTMNTIIPLWKTQAIIHLNLCFNDEVMSADSSFSDSMTALFAKNSDDMAKHIKDVKDYNSTGSLDVTNLKTINDSFKKNLQEILSTDQTQIKIANSNSRSDREDSISSF